MIRKISKVGPSSLMISLPSKWCKKYDLKKGNEVDLIEDTGTLKIILKDFKLYGSSITITLPEKEKFMRRQITRLYTQGFDEIKIFFKDNESVELIEKTLNFLIGFELIDMGKDSCIIKNISKEIESEFDNILRKLFLIILMMADRCVEFIKTNDRSELMKNLETEKVANKYTYFCERIINKKRFGKENKTNLFVVVFTLEQVADRYLDISKHLLERKLNISLEEEKYLKEINNLFRKFYEQFYSRKNENIFFIRNKHFEIKNAITKNLDKTNPPLFFHYSSLLVFIEHLNQITY